MSKITDFSKIAKSSRERGGDASMSIPLNSHAARSVRGANLIGSMGTRRFIPDMERAKIVPPWSI